MLRNQMRELEIFLEMKNYKNLVKTTLKSLTRALDQKMSVNSFSREYRSLLNSYAGMNRTEKYMIWREVYSVYRANKNNKEWEKIVSQRKTYDRILMPIRKVDKSMKLRNRKNAIKNMLNDPEGIFYMCSVHQNCRDLHKEYQGKVFVDRFWRTKVTGDLYYSVLSYIKNRGVKTVQEAMKEPIWLTTAVNCKHYFIPLNTTAVLTTSPKKLKEKYYRSVKKYTPEEYYDLRKEVYSDLNQIHPCNEFEKMSKK